MCTICTETKYFAQVDVKWERYPVQSALCRRLLASSTQNRVIRRNMIIRITMSLHVVFRISTVIQGPTIELHDTIDGLNICQFRVIVCKRNLLTGTLVLTKYHNIRFDIFRS